MLTFDVGLAVWMSQAEDPYCNHANRLSSTVIPCHCFFVFGTGLTDWGVDRHQNICASSLPCICSSSEGIPCTIYRTLIFSPWARRCSISLLVTTGSVISCSDRRVANRKIVLSSIVPMLLLLFLSLFFFLRLLGGFTKSLSNLGPGMFRSERTQRASKILNSSLGKRVSKELSTLPASSPFDRCF